MHGKRNQCLKRLGILNQFAHKLMRETPTADEKDKGPTTPSFFLVHPSICQNDLEISKSLVKSQGRGSTQKQKSEHPLLSCPPHPLSNKRTQVTNAVQVSFWLSLLPSLSFSLSLLLSLWFSILPACQSSLIATEWPDKEFVPFSGVRVCCARARRLRWFLERPCRLGIPSA